MIPDERFSSEAVQGRLLHPWSRSPKTAYQRGPVQVQDNSGGLLAKLWTLRAEGPSAILSADDSPTQTLFTRDGDIDNISLSFDQNSRPLVCFEEVGSGESFLFWWDPEQSGYEFMALPSGITSPRITLDDARRFNVPNSDVILGYIREGLVRYRRQRDRFQVEHTPTVGEGGEPVAAALLHHISMNDALRLEFITDEAA